MMGGRWVSNRRAGCWGVLVAILLMLSSASGASTWKVQKLGGRDYLSLSQVAGFYRMRMARRGDKGLALMSDGRRMEFQLGSREARIDGVKHWLSFPVVSYAGGYFVSRMDLSKTIDPVMRPHRIATLEPMRTVVLDPGHGGHDRGAVNRLGYEKNYNLDMSRRIRAYLQKAGYRVLITRSRDEFIRLEDRPAKAARLGKGTVFVSIHFNYSDTPGSGATGYEVFTLTPQGAPNSNDSFFTQRSFSVEPGHRMDHPSMALATSVQHAMLGRLPMFDRGVKRARFAVLRRAVTPAVLIEGGFMSNAREARSIHSPEWRERLAEGIADGIIQYGELTRTRSIPKFLAQYRAERAPLPEEFQYNPLAGIAAAYRQGVPCANGWRDLLVAPLSEDAPAFRLKYALPGLEMLELWMVMMNDAREIMKEQAQQEAFVRGVWPEAVSKTPGVKTVREMFPVRGEEEKFELYSETGGPVSDGSVHEVIPAVVEISGGVL